MTLDSEKLARLAETERLDLDFLRKKVLDVAKDKNGSASNTLAGTLRFLAVADYVLSKNVGAFRSQLSEAAELRRKLFERFDAGESVSPSYVSMIAHKSLFNALAAGDEVLAKAFAARIGGREAIEREYDRPFDLALGYTLKNLLAPDDVAVEPYLAMFEGACKEPDNADFRGYATVLRAALNRDEEAANQGFVELIAGHKCQSKGGGLFKDTEDEVLCVWGIGLANLVRMHGLAVQPNDPMIPVDLLV